MESSIPEEIHMEILSYLDPRELLICVSLVNHHFRRLCIENSLWKSLLKKHFQITIADIELCLGNQLEPLIHKNTMDYFKFLKIQEMKPVVMNWYLKVLKMDGQQLSDWYSADNILNQYRPPFCTAEGHLKNVNLVFVSSKPFLVTRVSIESPSASYTSPLGKGCMFSSDVEPNFEDYKPYDSIDEKGFEELCSGQRGKQFVRRGLTYFDCPIEGTWISDATTFHKQCAKYIVMKMIGANEKKVDRNIDARYVRIEGLFLSTADQKEYAEQQGKPHDNNNTQQVGEGEEDDPEYLEDDHDDDEYLDEDDDELDIHSNF